MLLTALMTAMAIVFLSATQLTQRNTAQHYLARALTSLLEIDQFVLNAWPELEAGAEHGGVVPLSDYPLTLQLDREALADGPGAVSEAIAAATASLVYDAGLEALSDSPRAFRVFSRGALFEGSVGRLTRGGHELATVTLVVSGTLAILLSLATAAQTRGLSRFAAPGLAIAVGALLVWIGAFVVRSAFAGQAESTADPFAAELALIAADAVSLLVRNAAIAGLASGSVAALALIGGGLLRVVDDPGDVQAARFR